MFTPSMTTLFFRLVFFSFGFGVGVGVGTCVCCKLRFVLTVMLSSSHSFIL